MIGTKLSRCGWMRWRRGGDAGQALVETALVMPLMVLLLLGAGELARVAYAAIEVANAAKAAVQYGTQNPATMGDSPGMLLAAQNDAYNLSGIALASASITTVCSDGSTYDSGTNQCSGAGAHVEDILTVTTSVSFDPLIYIPGLPKTFTLYGRAIQKCLDC